MAKDEFNELYPKIIQAFNECDIILAAKETAEQACQRGLDEAREAARKIVDAYFDDLAKLREYEERKKAEDEAIKVGDEVTWASEPTHYVVVSLVKGKGAAVLASGKSHWVNKADLRKTGRHFPQIAEVLWQIANDE